MNQRPSRSQHAASRTLLPRRAGRAAFAAFITGSVAAGSLAAAVEPTAEELLAQIQKLQQQVEQMQSGAPAQQASDSSPAARVLDDAERRASTPVMAYDGTSPFLAGHDGQFVLRSEDGNFQLNPTAMLQFRTVTNFNNVGGDAFETVDFGVEMRRVQLGARGHAFTPDLQYQFQFGFDQHLFLGDHLTGDLFGFAGGGAARLQVAAIEYVPTRGEGGFLPMGLGLRAGQFKDMTFYEENVHAGHQLAAERSLVNTMLGGGHTRYIQGIGPVFNQDQFRAVLLYTGGPGSANTPWHTVDDEDFDGLNWDYGIAARVDFYAMGNRAAAQDFTARLTDENMLRFGAGGHWAQDGAFRVLYHSVDAQFETAGGLGVFAAFYGIWSDDGNDNGSYDMGLMAQVSQSVGRNMEIFARYSILLFEDEMTFGGTAEDTFHEITVGLNQYYYGHRLKMTIDVNYLPSGNPDTGGFFGTSGLGYQPNVGEFNDQVSIRGQIQFML